MNSLHKSFQLNSEDCNQNDNEHTLKLMNDNLCSTFEGLFKNEKQNQEYTMSTAWNESSVSTNHSNSLQNDQNQKIILESQQYPKEHQKINKIECQKKSLISQRTSKYKKLKNILPYYYTVRLPDEYKNLLVITQKVDKYLIEKRKTNFYMDNVFNIFRRLFENEQLSTIWTQIKRAMFLQEDYYKINTDPMKNLALGIFNKKDTKLYKRKQRLRKALVDYYLTVKNQDKNQIVQEIPESLVQPSKTSKFYLQNMDLVRSKPIKQISPKLKPEYINSLKSSVTQKQTQLQGKQLTKNKLFVQDLNQLIEFCDIIEEIYCQRKVKNMYKVSLIESLRKRQKFQISKIFQMIKLITKEQLFLEILIKSDCQIFHIIPQEKHKLIQFIKTKNHLSL